MDVRHPRWNAIPRVRRRRLFDHDAFTLHVALAGDRLNGSKQMRYALRASVANDERHIGNIDRGMSRFHPQRHRPLAQSSAHEQSADGRKNARQMQIRCPLPVATYARSRRVTFDPFAPISHLLPMALPPSSSYWPQGPEE